MRVSRLVRATALVCVYGRACVRLRMCVCMFMYVCMYACVYVYLFVCLLFRGHHTQCIPNTIATDNGLILMGFNSKVSSMLRAL